MQDLNDLFFFAQVVKHGGFAPAGRALGLPKSKLSRRVAELEERLGVRLIQRSTRHFLVTDIGQVYYAHCRAMLVEAEAAHDAIEQTRSEPCGLVRLTCPVALLHDRVGGMLADFMVIYPRVDLLLEATNRRVDVIAEGVDVALRVRRPPLEDSELLLKVLGEFSQCLVASPALLERSPAILGPSDLSGQPSLALGARMQEHVWQLEGPDKVQAAIRHRPRLVTDDMIALRAAAMAGVGVVQLPMAMVRDQTRQGLLVSLLPEWVPKGELLHAVYPSRRGLLPSVCKLLDYLAERFGQLDVN